MAMQRDNNSKAIKKSLDEFLLEKGLNSPISDFLTDKLRGNRQLRTYKGEEKFKKEADLANEEYHAKKEKAIKEYNRLVKEGKIIPKTNLEKYLDTSKGFYEVRSTQAARRMCLKQGINWLTGESIIIEKNDIDLLHLTHNEYQKYLEELVSKLYDSDIEYNMEDFMKDSNLVKIIDFDLEQYHLPDDIKKIINTNMLTNQEFEDHETFFGHVELNRVHNMSKLLHCECGLPFRYAGYFRNNENMMIIDYAEGDFSISLYKDKLEFNKAVIRTHNFYEPENFYLLNNNVWTMSQLQELGEENNPDLAIVYDINQLSDIGSIEMK